jgi:hypothetical protein
LNLLIFTVKRFDAGEYPSNLGAGQSEGSTPLYRRLLILNRKWSVEMSKESVVIIGIEENEKEVDKSYVTLSIRNTYYKYNKEQNTTEVTSSNEEEIVFDKGTIIENYREAIVFACDNYDIILCSSSCHDFAMDNSGYKFIVDSYYGEMLVKE